MSPAPTIGLSRTTVAFSGTPGAPTPAPEAVMIANAGGGTLDDLQLGTVAYGAGATGWLSASLDRADAPATLTLVATTGSLPLGTYSATVPVTSASASNSPQTVAVTFTVAAGAAAVLQLNAGDNQNAAVGAAVAIHAEGYDQTFHGKVSEIPDRVVPRSLKPLDPSRPVDTRVLVVKIALNEAVPLKLGQRVEVEIER